LDNTSFNQAVGEVMIARALVPTAARDSALGPCRLHCWCWRALRLNHCLYSIITRLLPVKGGNIWSATDMAEVPLHQVPSEETLPRSQSAAWAGLKTGLNPRALCRAV